MTPNDSARPSTADRGGRGPWSVREHLVLIVAVAGVALAGTAVYGYVWSSGEARDAAIEAMGRQADRAAAAVEASLARGTTSVTAVAAQPGIEQVFGPAGQACTLTAEDDLTFASVRLDIVRADGTVACSSDPSAAEPGAPEHPAAVVAEAMRADETTIEPNGTDAIAGEPALVVAARIPQQGEPAGAVLLFAHLPTAAATLARTFASSENVSFALVDPRTGAVASSTDRVDDDAFPVDADEGELEGVGGEPRLFGSAPVAGTPWRLYAGVRRAAVLAEAEGAAVRQAAFGVVALLVLIAAAWWLNRRVAGPLRAVTAAVTRANRDPLGPRATATGAAELVTLGRELNTMLDVRAGHEAQLEHQAHHDLLTGLPNEAALRELLDAALRESDPGAEVGVLWIGIRGLGTVGEGFGHQARDRVALAVADRVGDELGPDDMLARPSRDELAVLRVGCSPDELTALADRLRACLEQSFEGPAGPILLQSSIGIAAAPAGATTTDHLLREADSAMGEARRQGKPWERFQGELQRRATRQLRLAHDIRQALHRGEFVVHYQPLLDVATGRIVGAEALVRWRHPERGLVAPAAFIPIAEETGQIVELGNFVLARACEQAAGWAAAGHRLRVSVNVAVAQLAEDGFIDVVQGALAQSGLPASSLCVEVTESSLIREGGDAWTRLEQLERLGVQIAIDDFGTGYSSLAYLHDLPAREIKIDRSFIGRLDRDPRDRHLVEAVIGMAQALGLTVVAEGVETASQLAVLDEAQCELAQGYLFARPGPAETLLELLEDHDPAAVLAGRSAQG